MYGNIFFDELEIKADKPIDKRLYIDSLNTANLEELFEVDGKYSFLNLVLFNKADKLFYYLSTRATPIDAIDPSNWTAIQSTTSSFVEYVVGSTYNVGDCVYEIDGGLVTHFYIATDSVAIGETPLTTPAKWLEVTSGGGAVWQKQTERINPAIPAGNSTRTFDVNISSALNDGHLPSVMIWAEFDDGGPLVWKPIVPNVKLDDSGSTLYVEFTGDLTDIHYDAGDNLQNNIQVEIR